MAPNGSGLNKATQWIIGLLFVIALGAVGFVHAEIVRVADKSVTKDEFGLVCNWMERIDRRLEKLTDRLNDLQKP